MPSNLEDLRANKRDIVTRMQGILDAACDSFTPEQEAEYDALETELGKLDARIKRQESLDAVASEMNSAPPAVAQRQYAVPGPEAKKEFETLAEFFVTAVKNPSDQRLEYQHQDLAADQTMGTGSEGGFAIPTQFRDQLLAVSSQAAIIGSRSNRIPAGTPPDAEITMPALDQTGSVPDNVYGGVACDWIGEGVTKPATEAVLRQVSLTPYELAAHIPVTDKLLRNWLAASSVLENLLGRALVSAQEHAFFNGNGSSKPTGFVGSGAEVTVNRMVANQVNYDDLANMVSKLLMREGSPYWLVTQAAMPFLLTMESENGQLIWQQNAVDGSPGSILGYPVFWHERSSALGTAGDVALVNTDPYYLIKEGSGPFIDTGFSADDFVKNKRRIKIFTNVDGKPWLTAPFKTESGYQVSPFVVLGDVATT